MYVDRTLSLFDLENDPFYISTWIKKSSICSVQPVPSYLQWLSYLAHITIVHCTRLLCWCVCIVVWFVIFFLLTLNYVVIVRFVMPCILFEAYSRRRRRLQHAGQLQTFFYSYWWSLFINSLLAYINC